MLYIAFTLIVNCQTKGVYLCNAAKEQNAVSSYVEVKSRGVSWAYLPRIYSYTNVTLCGRRFPWFRGRFLCSTQFNVRCNTFSSRENKYRNQLCVKISSSCTNKSLKEDYACFSIEPRNSTVSQVKIVFVLWLVREFSLSHGRYISLFICLLSKTIKSSLPNPKTERREKPMEFWLWDALDSDRWSWKHQLLYL